jgi:hypothetical protein
MKTFAIPNPTGTIRPTGVSGMLSHRDTTVTLANHQEEIDT